MLINCRALQTHPKSSKFWILAASWEFENNGNISTARKIMQQGLRLNAKNYKMWLEYFKLEFLALQKVIIRRQLLKTEDNVLILLISSHLGI